MLSYNPNIVRRVAWQPKMTRVLYRAGLWLFLVLLSIGVFSYTRAGARLHTRGVAQAAVSSTLNFQARLLTTGGALVPDGNYNIEFKLFNASSSSGSSQGSCAGDAACVWVETRSGGNVVNVQNGYFSVNLGSVTAFGSINWDQEHWLTMNVGGIGAPSWDGEMSPRIKLTAVPYSFRAGAVMGASGAFTADDLLQKAPASLQIISSANAGLRFNQTGAGGLIQLQGDGSDVFTVSKTGATVLAGASLTIGGSSQSGAIILNDGSSNTGTLQLAALAQNTVFTLPDPGGGSATVCISTGNCAGFGDISNGGNSFGSIITIGTNDPFDLNFETNGTTRQTIQSDGDIIFDTNTLFVDAANNRIGIGTITPTNDLSFGVGSNRTIFIEDQTAANTNGDALIIKPAKGNGTSTGGALSLLGGDSGTVGTGGLVTIQGGAGGSTSGAGGGVSILGGTTTQNLGGSINITAGNGAGVVPIGGDVILTSGSAAGVIGSSLTLEGTTIFGGLSEPGDAILSAGNGYSTVFDGGAVTITSGSGGTTTNGGLVAITAGAGGSSSGAGGTAVLQGGAASGGNSNGGAVNITGGASIGTATAGSVVINGGAGDTAGGITLDAGSATTTKGSLNLGLTNAGLVSIGNSTSGLVINSTNIDISSGGAISGITSFTQASGNFVMNGSGTFDTGTGLVSLKGNTSIASGKTFAVAGVSTIAPTGSGEVALTITGTTGGTAANALVINQAGQASNLVLSNTGATSSALVNLSHNTSAFTGTGLLVNIANGSGTFASGNFADFQINGASRFRIDNTGALEIRSDSTTALVIKNAAGTDSLLTVNSGGNIVFIGDSVADGTGVIFVLDNKNTDGDPAGQEGAQYYNLARRTFRCYENSRGWTDCIGSPRPNTHRVTNLMYPGTGTVFHLVGDVSTAGTAPTSIVATATEPAALNFATGAVSGNVNHHSGNTNYSSTSAISYQSYISLPATTTVRHWAGITNQTAATMAASANPAGRYAAFRYDTGAGDANWKCVTQDNVTQNVIDSGVAIATTGFRLEIILTTVTATFKINGAEVCSTANNLPGAAILMRYTNTVTTLAAGVRNMRVSWVNIESY